MSNYKAFRQPSFSISSVSDLCPRRVYKGAARLLPTARTLSSCVAVVALLSSALSVGAAPIRVPIRWCFLEGAPSLNDPTLVGEETPKDVLWRRHERATEFIYLNQANISFRSGAVAEQTTFPVLDDETPVGGVGDVVIPLDDDDDDGGDNGVEFDDIIARCRMAWEEAPEVTGVTAVQIDQFVDKNGNVTGWGGFGYRGGGKGSRTIVTDNSYRLDVFPDPQDKLVAHEFGHTLGISHGNGLDDDDDGEIDDGDADGDDDGVVDPDEEADTFLPLDELGDVNLMEYRTPLTETSTDGNVITSGQVGELEDFISGNIPDAENVDGGGFMFNGGADAVGDVENFPWADIDTASVTVDAATGTTRFFSGFQQTLPESVPFNVYFFVNSDNDLATGGDPSQFLPPGQFSTPGVELAVIVNVTILFGSPTVNAAVWQYDSDIAGFVQIVDPGILAQVTAEQLEGDDLSGGQSVLVQTGNGVQVSIPSSSIDAPGMRPLLVVHTLAQLTSGVIPLDTAKLLLSLRLPDFPDCAVTPETARPGQPVTVNASDLPSDQKTKVFLGDEMVGEGQTDFAGNDEILFNVPPGTASGLHLVTVGLTAPNLAMEASCELNTKSPTQGECRKQAQKLCEGLTGFEYIQCLRRETQSCLGNSPPVAATTASHSTP